MIQASDKIAIIAGERQVSFTDMLRHVSHLGETTPADGAKTIILSENREGWLYALYAIWARRGIAVPVDAGSTVHDVAYILRDCSPAAVWTSREKESVVREAIDEARVEVAVNIIDDVETEDVSEKPVANIEYKDNDTCLICYTSGTTGSPKGVMLSYLNVLANVNAVWKEVPIFDETLRTIILLPLHHVLPLVGSALAPMVVGCGVAISPSLSAADIMGTLQRGRIGIMIGVPRLWQTLFRGIKAKVDANAVTRMLYNLCDKVQSRTLSRLIFKSVHNKMGGNLKYCVSGGAALDKETARGLTTLGLDLLEGYGMTETAPIISFTRPGDLRLACVGLAMPSVEVKVVDGELCARGCNVMKGYYNRPEETAAIIDAEGFVHTGDLATIDETGHIYITGRKKEIIVLSNGKNVNPTEIEEKIEHFTEYVKEAAVTEANDMLKAIIVPQDAWAKGKSDAEMEEAIKRVVLEPYNETVAPYKKVMSLLIYHGELPRTRLEKLQRYRLKEILAGTSQPIATPVKTSTPEPTTEEYRILAEYIAAEKHLDVHPDDNLETDLLMDSLDKVSLQGFIEQTFGVEITAGDLATFNTIARLAEHVGAKKTHIDVEEIDWKKLLTRPVENMKLPHMAATGVIFTRLARSISRLCFGFKTSGHENIPVDGPFILAPNHQSYLDAPLVVSDIDSRTLRRTYFYAKKDHVRGPIMRLLARNHNVVIMDLSTLKDSIRVLGQILSDGNNLVIFPEGTRTRNGEVGEFKKTFAILSKELNVPIVPVRIEGAYEAWPRNHKLPRFRKVSVKYLPAIKPSAEDTYETLAARVRSAIAES